MILSLQKTLGDLVDVLPLSVDVSLGNSAAGSVEAELGPVLTDVMLTGYVTRVGKNLAAYSSEPSLPYTFKILHNDDVNAFALPGGNVYITTGLLEVLETEAQLAAVLGHEIGHAADRHGVKQFGVGASTALLTEVAFGRYLTDAMKQEMAGMVLGLISSGYSRHHEERADHLGLQNSVAAGYDPQGAVEVMKVFDILDGQEPGAIESWFTSHPASGDRVSAISKEIRDSYPEGGFVGFEEYQQAVRGRISSRPPVTPNAWITAAAVVAGVIGSIFLIKEVVDSYANSN